MSENGSGDPFRTWRLSILERWDEWEQSGDTWIDSSPAWRHFEKFLARHGYQICYYYAIPSLGSDTRPKKPQYDYPFDSSDPFKPSTDRNRPFVFHDPTSEVYERHDAIWKTYRPKVTYAYDKYNRVVVIKAVPIPDPTSEIEILLRFNSEPLRPCADNHTIPLLAHLVSDEGWQFLVMPAWRMTWTDSFKIWQVDEYFAILIQALDGMAFLHKNGIAHMDINDENIVFNQDGSLVYDEYPLVPALSKWDFCLAFIDFGLSIQFDPLTNPNPVSSVTAGTANILAPENEAADITKNEYQLLPADASRFMHYVLTLQLVYFQVYSLAAMYKNRLEKEEDVIRQVRWVNKYPTYAHDVLRKHVPIFFEIFKKMMDVDPSKRPTAAEALQMFKDLREETPKHIRFASPAGYPGEILLL